MQAVLRWLSEAKSQTVLLDAYRMESAGFEHSPSESLRLAIGREQIQLSDVTSVWWRQKAKPQVPSDSVMGLYDYSFVQREWNTIFDYLAARTDNAFAINDRQKAKLAENKAYQLEVAGDFSFNVPKTIITNGFEHAVRFFELAGVSRCVYKSFSPYMPPNATMAYTTELDMEEISRKEFQETVDATPGIFQELIESDHELRVMVVGEMIFTARIDPPDGQRVDWRSSIFDNKYSHASLPKALEEELLRYHAKLGLVFAAYDFIVTKSQDIFFLEANPSGQWMWLEQQLGMPISEAVGEQLRRRGT
ncbi:MAG: hypothetical protein WA970_03490 [Gammaproteobacteria bacterium]